MCFCSLRAQCWFSHQMPAKNPIINATATIEPTSCTVFAGGCRAIRSGHEMASPGMNGNRYHQKMLVSASRWRTICARTKSEDRHFAGGSGATAEARRWSCQAATSVPITIITEPIRWNTCSSVKL